MCANERANETKKERKKSIPSASTHTHIYTLANGRKPKAKHRLGLIYILDGRDFVEMSKCIRYTIYAVCCMLYGRMYDYMYKEKRLLTS